MWLLAIYSLTVGHAGTSYKKWIAGGAANYRLLTLQMNALRSRRALIITELFFFLYFEFRTLCNITPIVIFIVFELLLLSRLDLGDGIHLFGRCSWGRSLHSPVIFFILIVSFKFTNRQLHITILLIISGTNLINC